MLATARAANLAHRSNEILNGHLAIVQGLFCILRIVQVCPSLFLDSSEVIWLKACAAPSQAREQQPREGSKGRDSAAWTWRGGRESFGFDLM